MFLNNIFMTNVDLMSIFKINFNSVFNSDMTFTFKRNLPSIYPNEQGTGNSAFIHVEKKVQFIFMSVI